MGRRILKTVGSTLLEVTAIILIMGVIMSVVIPASISRINAAKYQKTVNELTAIAQASVDFFLIEGSWPTGISQLYPQFMPKAVTSSPFQTTYQISCVNNMVTASVLIPVGIALGNQPGQLQQVINQGAQDQIQITKIVQNELTSRLSYTTTYGIY